METNNLFDVVFAKFKSDYPKDWPQYVRKANKNIKAALKQFNLDSTPAGLRDAIANCMVITDGPATAAAYFVAAGIITRLQDLENDHISIEQRALRIELQQEKLLTCTEFSNADKATLTEYYSKCLAKVTTITDRIMNEAFALTISMGINAPKPVQQNNMPTYIRHHGSQWGGRGGAVSV